MKHIPQILILGPGAVGVFFGAKLAASGRAHVSVVARSDYDALSKRDFTYFVQSPAGDFRFRPGKVFASVDQLDFEPDAILVGLKTYAGMTPVDIVRPAVRPMTEILLLQNGIGNDEAFLRAFPHNRVTGCVVYIGAERTKPGHLRHTDGGRLILGPALKNTPVSPLCEELAQLWREAGVPVELTTDIAKFRWIKLLWNTPFNTISILGRSADTASIMNTPEACELARGVMLELLEIAAAEGINIPPEYVRETLEYTRTFPPYKPSSLQDFERNRPLELAPILDVPLQLAEKHRIHVPKMQTIQALLRLAARNGHP